MATTFAPFGMTPARKRGSAPDSRGVNRYRIANGYATDIFKGNKVAVNTAGFLCAVTIESSINELNPIGIFQGCEYTDPVTKQPTWSRHWPAATSSSGDTVAYGLVYDDPTYTFYVQADASLTAGDIARNFNIVASATANEGSTLTGRGTTHLDVGTRTTALADVRVIGFDVPNNVVRITGDRSDQFPIVEVQWVRHRSLITSV